MQSPHFTFTLPASRRSEAGREVTLRQVARAFREQTFASAIVATGGNIVAALARTSRECHRAALVSLGGKQAGADHPADVLYYSLDSREEIAFGRMFNRLHGPTEEEAARILATATPGQGREWTFDLPPTLAALAEDPEAPWGILTLRELTVGEAEDAGDEVLRTMDGTAGIGAAEKRALVGRAFVGATYGDAQVALDSTTLRLYRAIQHAYDWLHRPSEEEVEASLGTLRLA